VLKMLLTTVRLPFLMGAMLCGALANGLAFLVLFRMRSLGHRVGIYGEPLGIVCFTAIIGRSRRCRIGLDLPLSLAC
jgi:hypothetical protein